MAPGRFVSPLPFGENGRLVAAKPHILRPIDKALEDAKLPRYTAEKSGLW
jgi:hypothetical protein